MKNQNTLRIALSLSAIAASILAPLKASANEFPAASQEVIVWSARSCYAEATWSQADCAALLHVIAKRANKYRWSFLKMLKAYSVKNWVQSDHGKVARTLRLGANPRQDERWNSNWFDLVTHVVDVLQGRVVDPCPTADHWAAKYYHPRTPMRRVRCQASMANAFYAEI